jgi:hypothetical protein
MQIQAWLEVVVKRSITCCLFIVDDHVVLATPEMDALCRTDLERVFFGHIAEENLFYNTTHTRNRLTACTQVLSRLESVKI